MLIDSDERFGSWFLKLSWQDETLSKAAELALTNPDATPDETTQSAFISVRASASNDEAYICEPIFEARRALRRNPTQQWEDWLLAAVARAQSYTVESLTEAYLTGQRTFRPETH